MTTDKCSMRIYLFFILIYTQQSFTQDTSNEKLANDIKSIAEFTSTELNNIQNIAIDSCFKSTALIETDEESAMSCSYNPNSQEDLNNQKVVVVEIDQHKNLPDKLKQHIPGKAFETGHGGITLVLESVNDNILYGVWGIVFGQENDGDDFGFTHSMDISLGKTNFKGITYKGSLYTGLYTVRTGKTEKIDGRSVYPQRFTNETRVELNLDNIQQDKKWYWKAGAGFVKLDSEKQEGILRATGQQAMMHKATAQYDFNNSTDGKGIRNGAAVNAIIGFQMLKKLGANCKIRTYAETGGRFSSLEDDHISLGAGINFFKQKPESNKVLFTKTGINSRLHNLKDANGSRTALQTQANLSLGYSGQKAAVEIGVTKSFGDLQNYASYNLDKDLLVSAKVLVFLGTGKKKNKKLNKSK